MSFNPSGGQKHYTVMFTVTIQDEHEDQHKMSGSYHTRTSVKVDKIKKGCELHVKNMCGMFGWSVIEFHEINVGPFKEQTD